MSEPRLLKVERGRDLTDAEISDYLADRQTAIRHGTADIGTEIAVGPQGQPE